MRKNIFYIMLLLIAILLGSACAPIPADKPAAVKNQEDVMETVKEDSKETAPANDAGTGEISVDGKIDEGEYLNSYNDSSTGLILYWHNDKSNLYIGLQSKNNGWASIGFDPEKAMQGANLILVAMDGDNPIIRDDYGDGMFSHTPDEELGGNTDIISYAGKKNDSGYTFEFAIPMDSGDDFDKKLESGQQYTVILAVHASSIDFDLRHTSKSSTVILLD